MQYKDVIHPEEEYRAFGKMLIDADPTLDDRLEDQDIINMYNQIKAKDPSITLQQMQQLLPPILQDINAKMGGVPEEEAVGKLNALESIPMGE
jgi:hypothetical protein